MKNKIQAIVPQPNGLSDQEFLPLTPSMQRFVEKYKDQIPYHKSYLMAQKFTIGEDLQELLQIQPELELLEVIEKIWADRPKNMDTRLVRELMIFICDEWEKLQASRVEQVEELELAAA